MMVDVDATSDHNQLGFVIVPFDKGYAGFGLQRSLVDELGAELRFHHRGGVTQSNIGVSFDLGLGVAQIGLPIMHRWRIFS